MAESIRETARLAREKRTVGVMVKIFCRAHHSTKGCLCGQCQSLLDYALFRLDRCRYGVEKMTCARCPTHCYKPDMRDQVRRVMRYAGRRMLLRHPVLAMFHVLDGWRKPRKDAH
jgi:hypothetical protein